ncbi:hypothetical protein [Clostridium sp. HBUAS56017]|uniref:hypothetical protein n=1 Tax=Clostridium sp. HBUAS56017 TaxID=2571128 RepID=UPI00117803D1|nr:hypothetical protein [Clostridium sp. HBUAS56017]
MKKILSIIFSCLFIVTLEYIGRFRVKETSLYILVWIYVVFPSIFILQGVICSNSIKSMIICFSLLSISILIPTYVWYKINGINILIIIYLLLGLIASHLKKM